jgi:hypothetical protein
MKNDKNQMRKKLKKFSTQYITHQLIKGVNPGTDRSRRIALQLKMFSLDVVLCCSFIIIIIMTFTDFAGHELKKRVQSKYGPFDVTLDPQLLRNQAWINTNTPYFRPIRLFLHPFQKLS